MKASLEVVQKFWDERARSGNTDCYRVDSSRRTQMMRFLAFAQVVRLEGSSILDIGCGTGDFLDFLKQQGINADYTGFDISPVMIERCLERFPDGNFISGEFITWMPERTFDYTIAIAIHNNVRVKDAQEILEATLRKQFEMAKQAAHMSVLSSLYADFSESMQVWNPKDILAMALDITPYVLFRHDYLLHDFSLTLFKEPTIDSWLGPRE